MNYISRKSFKVYVFLIFLLTAISVINVFLPQGDFLSEMPKEDFTTSKWVLALTGAAISIVIYGGLGLIGMKLSRLLAFPDLWSKNVTNTHRFIIPAIAGISIGIVFIFSDWAFSRFTDLQSLPHPPFPTSLAASISAAIGEEIIYRLFFISFWLWLIGAILFRGKHMNTIFWIIVVLSAIVFTAGHLPSVMYLYEYKSISEFGGPLLAELFLLNGILSVFAAYYFRKYGILAAIGIHFWTDVIWHVVWGAIG